MQILFDFALWSALILHISWSLEHFMELSKYLHLSNGAMWLCESDLIRAKELRGTWKIVWEPPAWDAEDDNLVICSNGENGESIRDWLFQTHHIGTRKTVLVVNDSDEVFKDYHAVINQRIYFFNTYNLTLSERYSIHNEHIVHVLAKLDPNIKEMVPIIDESFHQRRSNFHGEELKIMIDEQSPYLVIQDTPKSEVFSASGDSMYQVKPSNVQGFFSDMIHILAAEMDFKVQFLRRADNNWGSKVNGTWDGMVFTLLKGEADLIGGSLTLTPSRFEAVDYLLPIGTETYAIFIKKSDQEDWDFTVFFLPFQLNLWRFLLFNGVFGVGIFKLLDIYYSCNGASEVKTRMKHVEDILTYYWMILTSYFGQAFPVKSANGENAKRILFFTFMFVGNVVFMAYRASLTSELSNRVEKFPFITLDDLLLSDYQLIARKGGFSDSLFTHSEEGTIFHALYKKFLEENREDFMLHDISALLNDLQVGTKRALYYLKETIHTYEAYRCLFSTPWISNYPNFLSMAFPKKSPYREFFQFRLYQHLEKGSIRALAKRWTPIEPDCSENEALALGEEKLISLFTLFGIGVVLATIVFCFENVVGKMLVELSQEKAPVEPWFQSQQRRLSEWNISRRIAWLSRKVEHFDKEELINQLEDIVHDLKTVE